MTEGTANDSDAAAAAPSELGGTADGSLLGSSSSRSWHVAGTRTPAKPSTTTTSRPSMTAFVASHAGSDSSEQDPRTRVLKRGDLVRVLERRGPNVKERPEGLGRIHRSIPIPAEDLAPSQHPFRYDVDWVLGGRITNIGRDELVYTTAQKEGMLDAPRRKRKPSSVVVEAEAVTKKHKSAGVKGKKKGTASSAVKKKAVASKKSGSKTRGGKGRGTRRRNSLSSGALEADVTKPSNALHMYERHRREFERLFGRLERIDQFGFFLGEVPADFDESHVKNVKGKNTVEDDDKGVNSDDGKCPHPSTFSTESNSTDIIFPSQPPYNWSVLRKRAESGRYVLDRQKRDDEKRKELQKLYQDWLRDKGLGAAARAASVERPTSLVLSNDPVSTAGEKAAACDDKSANQDEKGRLPNPKGIDWNLFRQDVIGMCDSAVARDPEEGVDDGPGTLGYAVKKIKETVEQMYSKTGQRQMAEMEMSDIRQKYVNALSEAENNEAAMQGEWRKDPFPERRYERLERSNVICARLSTLDERSAVYELQTNLPNSFVGLSYTYDDMGQSEGWMKTVVDEADSSQKRTKKRKDETEKAQQAAMALSADDGVVKAQVRTTMDILLIGVQDKVMTDAGVLQHPEVRSANWDDGDQSRRNSGESFITTCASSAAGTGDYFYSSRSREAEVAEQPVWGMDCYTRKNVAICLEADLDSAVASEFIERWLLPAINSCPVHVAHDISSAARVLEGLPPIALTSQDGRDGRPISKESGFALPCCAGGSHVFLSKALANKIQTCGPPWLKEAAHRLRTAVEALGTDLFRIHPKGHGSVVLKKDGLMANTLVTHYRGEVYPPWRWGEKLDAIEKTQQRIGLRPNLPDFYNMALERPRIDPRGFGLLFVDASRKAGLGSSFSHSCDPTCEVKVVAVAGQLSLAMTTLRDLECGEELTFDYHAVTESVNEYHAAICLCGHINCRGSFLHFATADCYQQVLSRNAPIAVQFANLAKGCIKKVLSKEDGRVLESHGFGTAAFGAVSFNHHRSGGNEAHDSLDNVPIWLKTFAADTLRYIEYERRALPIALLSNHFTQGDVPYLNQAPKEAGNEEAEDESHSQMSKSKGRKVIPSKSKKPEKTPKSSSKADDKKSSHKESSRSKEIYIPPQDRKPIPGSKPDPAFFFFSKRQKDTFISILKEEDMEDLPGFSFNSTVQKIAGSTWRNLSDDMKQHWKDMSYADWEMNGGKEKAKLEKERQLRISAALSAGASKQGSPEVKKIKGASKGEDGKKRKVDDSKHSKKKQGKKRKFETAIETNKISFEAADAEGWAAMEQRIHQLTQTLSRVGRVLDRHREADFASRGLSLSAESNTFQQIHSPLAMMSDENVVGWLWNHPEGVTQTLLREVGKKPWSESSIPTRVAAVIKKYEDLRSCSYLAKDGVLVSSSIVSGETVLPSKARRAVITALLELRDELLRGVREMETDVEQYDKTQLEEQAEAKKGAARKRSEQRKKAKEAKAKKEAFALAKVDAALYAAAEEANELDRQQAGEAFTPAPAYQSGPRPYVSALEQPIPPSSSGDGAETTGIGGKSELRNGAANGFGAIGANDTPAAKGQRGGSTKHSEPGETKDNKDYKMRPWQKQLQQKYKLESAADLLLMYAHTSTFFSLKPYRTFESTPIEVYARELGNAVPRSLIETNESDKNVAEPLDDVKVDVSESKSPEELSSENKVSSTTSTSGTLFQVPSNAGASASSSPDPAPYTTVEGEKPTCMCRMEGKCLGCGSACKRGKRAGSSRSDTQIAKTDVSEEICKPDQVVTSVNVVYPGHYVLSCLLQWYMGGISLKPGLPDMNGCIVLPPMSSCWRDKTDISQQICEIESKTTYTNDIRPKLVEWFEDRHQRGSPWSKDILQYFPFSTTEENCVFTMGSPILDLLITGNDENIDSVADGLKRSNGEESEAGTSDSEKRKRGKKSAAERLQSSVDEGMPAQAVANWVQCENPACMKWRRLPWHVDVDLLPEKFYCKNNKWNPGYDNCSAPEDEWDMSDAPVKFNDISLDEFKPGAKFDVIRKGKEHYTEATVLTADFGSSVKKVHFRFKGMPERWNEWVEAESTRIAPHQAYTRVAPEKKTKARKSGKRSPVANAKKRKSPENSATCDLIPSTRPPARTGGKRCGVCKGCRSVDCCKCRSCLDKPKFGGVNKMKRSCQLRVCTNPKSASLGNATVVAASMPETAEMATKSASYAVQTNVTIPTKALDVPDALQTHASALGDSYARHPRQPIQVERPPPTSSAPLSDPSFQALGGLAGLAASLLPAVSSSNERIGAAQANSGASYYFPYAATSPAMQSTYSETPGRSSSNYNNCNDSRAILHANGTIHPYPNQARDPRHTCDTPANATVADASTSSLAASHLEVSTITYSNYVLNSAASANNNSNKAHEDGGEHPQLHSKGNAASPWQRK